MVRVYVSGEMVPNLPKYKLLIVEDYLELLDTINYMLKNEFDVILAASAEEAFRMIDSHPGIDFLVTDFRLEGCDGWDGLDVSNRFRGKYPKAPILMLSASFPGNPRIQDFLSLPRTDFIAKPFMVQDLFNGIRKLLHPQE